MNLGAFSRFCPKCEAIELPNGLADERWMVTQDVHNPFWYWSNRMGCLIPPPNGMKTDFGSIPKAIQRIPHLDRMTFGPSYICHDDLYWFRYVLIPRFPFYLNDEGMIVLLEEQRGCLMDGIFEPDDEVRKSIYNRCFYLEDIGRMYADAMLSDMMTVQSHGDAAWERKVVRTGLFLGGWVPWGIKTLRQKNPPPQDHEICTA